MGEHLELLKRVSIFSELNESELRKLEKLLTSRVYSRDRLIVSQEDKGDALFIIAKGKVKVVLYGESGREMILSIFKEGDFFGEMALLDGQPRSANVIAIEDSELLSLNRQQFLDCLRENAELPMAIIHELCARLRRADEIIGNLALLDVYGRVARALLDMAEKEGERTREGVVIKERPTQQNIASMVGTSRETVSRALNEFARRGFCELHGKSIVIKETQLLKTEYVK
ncbi:MAG: Crp/Fnr family transcriptional regulator [Myxococcota bacterium]